MADFNAPVTSLRSADRAADFITAELELLVEDGLGIAKLQIWGPDWDKGFSDLLGCPPPRKGTQSASGGLTIAWLAPGEWLLSGDEPAVATRTGDIAPRLPSEALITDLTHGRTSLLLSGKNARGALEAHCPLDLWPTKFCENLVARSLLGDVGAFVARLPDRADGPSFRIIVDQTMGIYAARLLVASASAPGVFA